MVIQSERIGYTIRSDCITISADMYRRIFYVTCRIKNVTRRI